jgi:hypothetical protein
MFDKITNAVDLYEAVTTKAAELNCELGSGMSYQEQAEFFENKAENMKNHDDVDGLNEMANILRAAEKRWYEI